MPESLNIRRFDGVSLNVNNPETLAKFYTDILGMELSIDATTYTLGYGAQSARLYLKAATAPQTYSHSRQDIYWKIGITVPDVNAAYAYLMDCGVLVSTPGQFQDIGYLCHLSDPEGFQIELLQHTFEGRPKTATPDMSQPLGGGAHLAHVTLRTTDIAHERALYETEYGLSLLSIQPVPSYGFDLYFFAATSDTPPDPDLVSVDNREWLWQRPYPVLEIQHCHAPAIIKPTPSSGTVGYAGLNFDPGI